MNLLKPSQRSKQTSQAKNQVNKPLAPFNNKTFLPYFMEKQSIFNNEHETFSLFTKKMLRSINHHNDEADNRSEEELLK